MYRVQPLEKSCAFFDISVIEYPIQTFFCYMFSLWPLTVKVIQMLIHSEASLSVRVLRNLEILSSTTVAQNKMSVGFFNICTYTFNTFW